jgi:hypothetical protein
MWPYFCVLEQCIFVYNRFNPFGSILCVLIITTCLMKCLTSFTDINLKHSCLLNSGISHVCCSVLKSSQYCFYYSRHSIDLFSRTYVGRESMANELLFLRNVPPMSQNLGKLLPGYKVSSCYILNC